MSVLVNGQTADQFAAAAIAGGTKFNSLQLRVQVLPYSGSNNNHKGIMSAKVNNGVINSLPPLVSPQQIYQMLFSGVSAPSTGPVSSVPSPIDRKKSVLDLMLADANRLSASVSGKDKVRLEQHFDEIRAIERSLQNTTGGGTPTGGSCSKPADPGADPALGANAFVGWSNETLRGNVMADMIAYAFACDLTRVVSWMLTFDQVFLRNALNNLTDMHDDSHDQSNRKAQIAASTNWHASLFARLVDNLSRLPEGSGTVLDNTFLSLVFAESKTAHGRTGMRHVVAGSGSFIKLGQHIDGGGDHPGKIQITGLQAVGVASNKLNELTGTLTPLLK
jgi:hypothetical protein